MDNNNGQFVWHEYLAKDVKAAIAFYTDLIGWKTQPFSEAGGDYTMWVGSQGPLGGVMKLPDEAVQMGTPPTWMGHVQVGDVDAAAAMVKKFGGIIHKEPTDIPTVGRFSVIGDPQGAAISMFKPDSPMTPNTSPSLIAALASFTTSGGVAITSLISFCISSA